MGKIEVSVKLTRKENKEVFLLKYREKREVFMFKF